MFWGLFPVLATQNANSPENRVAIGYIVPTRFVLKDTRRG